MTATPKSKVNRGGNSWPVLRTYDGAQLRRIEMPIGGIGTGAITLGGRADLRSWEIFNEPAQGFHPAFGFFAIRTRTVDGAITVRVAEGPIDEAEYEGSNGSPASHAGLPRFTAASWDVAYPLAKVTLTDDAVPLDVELEAFNPLIPTDSDASGIPAAILRFVCSNPTSDPIDVSLCGSLDNMTGPGGLTERLRSRTPVDFATAKNVLTHSGAAQGIKFESPGWDPASPRFGSMAIAILNGQSVSARTSWADLRHNQSVLDFWDEFSAQGELAQVDPHGVQIPIGSLCDRRVLQPGESTAFTFVISWVFPNRRAWIGELTEGIDQGRLSSEVIGNYYSEKFDNAWAAVELIASDGDSLERRTVSFVSAVCDSGLPSVVAEAALFNLSTLRSQTVFRTPDGKLFGWEGVNSREGSCFGSCTHVWNYEFATSFLFGDLARTMRDTEFAHATDVSGFMSFRIGLPLSSRAHDWRLAAADGQLGTIVKLHRDWRLSGDDNMLSKLWPKAKAALEFCWLPGGWDADRDGVMEGVQHNTMDVEYYGPNPQMGTWYLAALRATEEMASAIGDDDFASQCRRLFESGSAWIDANLFTGEYYRQQIRPLEPTDVVLPGLRHPGWEVPSDTTVESNPDHQIGDGCLVDQLVGQLAAHAAGLGYLLDRSHVETALNSVARYNRVGKIGQNFNHMRAFGLGEESGLSMASYPTVGTRPKRPFPYFTEIMSGFEYVAASSLAMESNFASAEKIIASVRDRYDGENRNPFDEAECGRHYVRAMASWSAILAWTGFDYDAHAGRMKMSDVPRIRFWSSGDSWGTCEETTEGAVVSVNEGSIYLGELWLGTRKFRASARTLGSGESECLKETGVSDATTT